MGGVDFKVRFSFKMSATVSKKETFNDSHGFIVPQTQFDFFPGSRNKLVILDSYYIEVFLLYDKTLINRGGSVKMA